MTVFAAASCGGPSDPVALAPYASRTRALPEELVVPRGARLLAPVRRAGASDERPPSWRALMSVVGSPDETWREVLEALDRRFPGQRLQPRRLQGCQTDQEPGVVCDIQIWAAAGGETVSVTATLFDAPDDVTGRYVLTLSGGRSGGTRFATRRPFTYPGRRRRSLPDPGRGRGELRAGDPLAPARENGGRFVLLAGSRLVAQFGTGSITGGFDVLLRIEPGASPHHLGAAYARQAAQFEGTTHVDRRREGMAVVTHFAPPGGTGGYQGEIDVVDRPGRSEDFIYYHYYND